MSTLILIVFQFPDVIFSLSYELRFIIYSNYLIKNKFNASRHYLSANPACKKTLKEATNMLKHNESVLIISLVYHLGR